MSWMEPAIQLTSSMMSMNWTTTLPHFFERQQVLQVSLWDGIVMGGGVGLSIHSPIRIATERTMFAMPETGIGLFPDVGATWALTRFKGWCAHVGLLLGLSGERLGPADCMFSGVATHYCPSEKLPLLEEKLQSIGSMDISVENVSAFIEEVAAGAQPADEKSPSCGQ